MKNLTTASALLLAGLLACDARADDAYRLSSARLHPLLEQPSALAPADFDGDGAMDVAVSNAHEDPARRGVAILRGDGRGGLALLDILPTPGLPGDIAAADFDGDGRVDLAVAAGQQLLLLRNGADGQWASVPHEAGMALVGLVAADLDGDGLPDLAFIDPYKGRFATMRNTGGGFAAPVAVALPTPFAVGLGLLDVDGDGDTDLVSSDQNPYGAGEFAPLFINQGGAQGGEPGAFRAAQGLRTGASTVSPVVLDANGDGLDDVALSVAVGRGDGFGVLVQMPRDVQQPAGTPSPFAFAGPLAPGFLPTDGRGADLDGDGRHDVVFSYHDGLLPVLNRTEPDSGALTFEVTRAPEFITPARPQAIHVADMDGDGLPEGLAALRFSSFRGVAIATNQPLAPGEFHRTLLWPMENELHAGPACIAFALGALHGAVHSPTLHQAVPGESFDPATPRLVDVPGAGPIERLAAVDIDGDGEDDLLAVDASGGVFARITTRAVDGFQRVDAPGDLLQGTYLQDAMAWRPQAGQGGLALLTTGAVSLWRVATEGDSLALRLGGVAEVPDFVSVLGSAGVDAQGAEGVLAGPVLVRAAAEGVQATRFSGELLSGSIGGDFNGDGRMDVLAAGQEWSMLLADGDGDFQQAWSLALPGGFGGPMAVDDIDGDGDLDAVLLLAGNEAIGLWLNPGGGGEAPVAWHYVLGEPTDVLLMDWDGDGVKDAVVASPESEGPNSGIQVIPGIAGR